jgi:putative membrane protein
MQLSDGAAKLNNGAASLAEGIGTLRNGSTALTDGIGKLLNGAKDLDTGMEKFNKDGIEKISKAVDESLPDILARFKAVQEVSADYNSFSGISDGMNGKVRFIYVMDGTKQ